MISPAEMSNDELVDRVLDRADLRPEERELVERFEAMREELDRVTYAVRRLEADIGSWGVHDG